MVAGGQPSLWLDKLFIHADTLGAGLLAWVHPRISGKARLCALPHYGLDPKLNVPTAPGGSLVLQCNQSPEFESIAARHTETGAKGWQQSLLEVKWLRVPRRVMGLAVELEMTS